MRARSPVPIQLVVALALDVHGFWKSAAQESNGTHIDFFLFPRLMHPLEKDAHDRECRRYGCNHGRSVPPEGRADHVESRFWRRVHPRRATE